MALDPFKLSMVQLKKAAPREFQDFLNQFELYSTHVTAAVTDAPADNVLVAQGMARQCRSLLRAFAECEALERSQKGPSRS